MSLYFDEKNNIPKFSKIILHLVIALIALIVIFGSFVVVGAGERGVVLTWGAFNGQIFEPGLHFKVPIVQSVIKMSVRTEKIEVPKSEAYSHDLQVVDVHSVINYNIDPKAVGNVYQQYGENFKTKVLTPNLEASVKQTIAQYTAEELLAKRAEVQNKIETSLKEAVPNQFLVTKYALVNESFSAEFEKAIEAKQVALQEAEKAKNELAKAQVDAESRVAQARAEAEAIKLQSEAANNEKYVSLKALEVQEKAIEKWNGVLPSQMLPNSTVPFINLNK